MKALAIALAGMASLLAAPASGLRFELDTDRSELHFSLPATLHTVRGSFRFLAGRLRTGDDGASGEFVVDAKSGETGNAMRDRNLHSRVLDSANFPTILLEVDALELAADRRSGTLRGTLRLRGTAHPLDIAFSADDSEVGQLRAAGTFTVPYVAWGLPDPSNLILRVDPVAQVQFSIIGRFEAEGLP